MERYNIICWLQRCTAMTHWLEWYTVNHIDADVFWQPVEQSRVLVEYPDFQIHIAYSMGWFASPTFAAQYLGQSHDPARGRVVYGWPFSFARGVFYFPLTLQRVVIVWKPAYQHIDFPWLVAPFFGIHCPAFDLLVVLSYTMRGINRIAIVCSVGIGFKRVPENIAIMFCSHL